MEYEYIIPVSKCLLHKLRMSEKYVYMTVKYEMLLDNAYGMCITYEYRYDLRKWRSKWNVK
jgi:hypothetical protein